MSVALEEHLTGYFRKGGVRTTHQVSPNPSGDNFRTITLQWDVAADVEPPAAMTLELTLRLSLDNPGGRFGATVRLSKQAADQTKDVMLELPEIDDDEHSEATFANQVEEAFVHLATQLARAGTSSS